MSIGYEKRMIKRTAMKLRIRMFRLTSTMRPLFKLVVYDGDDVLSDKIILGYYNAGTSPPRYKLRKKEALHWIGKKAFISERAREMFKIAGIWKKHMEVQMEAKEAMFEGATKKLEEKRKHDKLYKYLESQEIH